MLKIETGRTGGDVAATAAIHIVERARASVSRHGVFCVALSGGSTPWKMLERLTGLDVPWNGIHVFQTDEREAPDGDPDRNATRLTAILGGSGLPDANLHLMPVAGGDLHRACETYARTIARHGRNGRLDLVHLGLGEDGHTASLAPGDPALGITDRDVAVAGPYRGRRRMTLTRAAIDRAAERVWVVTGDAKAAMLARLCAGDRGIPAGLIARRSSTVFADEAAATGLREPAPDRPEAREA